MDYKVKLQANNLDLQSILNTVNTLPTSGASANAVLYTPQTLTEAQKEQARENIGAISAEEVEAIINPPVIEFSETGEVVELNVDADTPLSVVSKIHRDSTWEPSNKLVLHQVSGSNFADFTTFLGGVGTIFTKNGLTSTINADGTVTIKGTNEHTGYTYMVDLTSFSDAEHAQRVYPAGTYTIASGFMLQVRAAKYPSNVSITGATGNLGNTFTVSEPFRITSLRYAVGANKTVDLTLPLGLFRGNSLPKSGYAYSGKTYTSTFTEPVYDGEFNWGTGELKDTDGQTVGYFNTHDVKSLPGTNYFWTGFGENTVANGSNQLGRVGLQLNDTAPTETVPTICDYTFIPTTKQGAYCLLHQKFGGGSKYFGSEVPMLTTKGTFAVKDAYGNVKHSKYIDPMFNHRGVSDVLTHKGLTKKWSDKFYLIKDPTSITELGGTPANYLFVWEFDESEFVTTGIPAKIHDIPLATPCFINAHNSEKELSTVAASNGEPYRAFFSYNAETGKYTLTVRGMSSWNIDYQIKHYSKAHFYYQLDTPYTLPFNFAISVDAGDQITFDADLEDAQLYIDEGDVYRWPGVGYLKDFNIDPTVTVFVPRNMDDAMAGMNNAAMLFNVDDPASGDATVQGYSWIGAGDGVTDYTVKIQAKLNELHERTDGGTINLGPGTYPISDSLLVYSNTKIIGDGRTRIEQRADNKHAFIWSGSDIRMCDLTIKLTGECTEDTGCIYVNSYNIDSGRRDERYPENWLVERCSVSNVTLLGTYAFSSDSDGYAYLSDRALAYRGSGILCNRMYFNYFDCDGLVCRYLYAGVNGGGGGNNFRIYVTQSRMAVIGGGGNNIWDISGHTYYSNYGRDGRVWGTDYVYYGEGSDASTITIGFYDIQWSKGTIYFNGYSRRNKYFIHTFGDHIVSGASTYWEGYHRVQDFGQGNVEVQPVKENYVGIGPRLSAISGEKYWNTQFNPSIHNALSGAGVWGTITSNKEWSSHGITLSDVCRYPKNTGYASESLAFILSKTAPSEEAPIEIIIDISNRPIPSYGGIWIQFAHKFVAEDYTVRVDTTNDGVFNYQLGKVVGNKEAVSYELNMKEGQKWIYRIKISITKALQIPEFTYANSGYEYFTINYNPDGLVGIVNIGMVSNEAYGRAFLGECGGSLYGNVDMHANTLKNLSDPVDDGDAVSKAYLEQRLAALEALINGS